MTRVATSFGMVLVASIGLGGMARAQDNFDLGTLAPAKKPLPTFLNAVEVGGGLQSRSSYHFRRYGGPADRGLFPLLGVSLNGRDPWDSGGTKFWSLDAALIGEDMRRLLARYGEQGRWQVGGFYTGFTRHFTESARTPFDGAGTAALTLPANWVSGNSSARFTTLEQNLKPLKLKTQWQTFGGELVLAPEDTGYELRLRFERRLRDGLRADSTAFGHEANFPVGVFFPQPVDYLSHRITSALSYADPRWQWSASYDLSTFNNAITSVTLPNPYSRSLGLVWPAGAFAGYPFAFGQYGLPPDNTAHQFALVGGYNFSPVTRLSARLSYAIHKQNEAFLPYTVNPRLRVVEPVPRRSLDGDIRKTFLSLSLTSRSGRGVDVAASYSFDERDNRTPIALYNYIPNDVQDQVQPFIPGVSRYIRYNLPRSWIVHRGRVEVGYRPSPTVRLSLAYTGDAKARSYQQVAHSEEHAVRVKALAGFAAGSAWVSYAYIDRGGSEYRDDASWNASHTANYLNASPLNQSIEHPLLRTYNLADRRRREAKAGLTADVGGGITLNGAAGAARDTYPRSTYGRQKARALLLDADVSYALGKMVSATAFYSREQFRFDQAGYYVATPNLFNPNQVWTAESEDTVHTFGARIDWRALSDRLKLSAAYDHAQGRSEIDVRATPFTPLAAVAPLPDGRELTHRLELRAAYALRPETTLKVGYVVERHTSRDWQYDNVGLAPVAQILGSGIVPPRYTVHVGSLSVLYQF